MFCATTTQIPKYDIVRPWGELKKIVDKVHKHVYGHLPTPISKFFLSSTTSGTMKSRNTCRERLGLAQNVFLTQNQSPRAKSHRAT